MPVARRIGTVYTPVEEHGGFLVKRDDLADERGVRGGKARTLGVICRHIRDTGQAGLTICASRNSVTPATVAGVCAAYGIPACIHTAAAAGPLPSPFRTAVDWGVRIVEHRPGYMSVLAARARVQAANDDYLMVGLGLDYPPAVDETARQVENLPPDIAGVVTAVGSGHMLEGIVRGLQAMRRPLPIIGVYVGRPPDMIFPACVALVSAGTDFGRPAANTHLGDLELNPYYEAKCLPFLRPGDLLWVVAR